MATEKIDLQQQIQFAKEEAVEIVESGEELGPIMTIFTPHGIDVVSIPLTNDMIKDVFKQVIGSLLQTLDAYAYIFVQEMWSARISKDSPLTPRLLSGEISVSDLPLDDKEEMLAIMAAENGESFQFWSAKIQYTRDDRRYLGEWSEIGSGEGRLVLKEW